MTCLRKISKSGSIFGKPSFARPLNQLREDWTKTHRPPKRKMFLQKKRLLRYCHRDIVQVQFLGTTHSHCIATPWPSHSNFKWVSGWFITIIYMSFIDWLDPCKIWACCSPDKVITTVFPCWCSLVLYFINLIMQSVANNPCILYKSQVATIYS